MDEKKKEKVVAKIIEAMKGLSLKEAAQALDQARKTITDTVKV